MPSAFGKPVTTANRFGAVAAATPWTFITTLTASASASLSYTSFDTTTYHAYMLYFSGFYAATNLTYLRLEASTDGGSTYGTLIITSVLANFGTGTISGNNQRGYGAPGATMNLFNNTSDNSNWPMQINGTLLMQYGIVGASVGWTSMRSEFQNAWQNGSAGPSQYFNSSAYKSETRVNALRFTFDAGNITRGIVKIYGIA